MRSFTLAYRNLQFKGGVMHGRSLSLTAGPLRAAVELGSEPVSVASGFRNFIDTPTRDKGQIFKVDGKPVDPSSPDSLRRLRELMARAARRLERGFDWPEALPGATERRDNPAIPSGYTYLLQFVAHDLVQSALSLAVTEDNKAALVNHRLSPMRLDTVYGGGPDVCPFAYAKNADDAALPRARLRLGRIKTNGTGSTAPPPRDIARAGRAEEPTLPAVKDIASAPMAGLSEPLIPDPRNDDHAIISQLTTLFHLLHNGLLAKLGDEDAKSGPAATAARYHHFLGARAVATTVYRNIVREDLLKRLLHPDVYQLHTGSNPPTLDRWDDRVPLEFSHGAFRCGHAMVRPEYRINSDNGRLTSEALRQTSLRGPANMPLDERWIVRWSHFFELEGSQPNLSRRIGPDYTAALIDNGIFPAVDEADKQGLAYRDLMSASLAGLWSVPHLIERIRNAPGFGALEFIDWQKPLTKWLAEYPNATGLTAADIKTLTDDPPLPVFVLFEAAEQTRGKSLGTLGSIIVSQVLFGAMRQIPLLNDAGGEMTPEALSKSCLADLLSSLLKVSTMGQLVTFMADSFDLRHQKPAFI